MSNRLQIAHYRPEGEVGAAVVSHGVNMGKGRAVKTSLKYAVEHGFDALVLLDGDGQHDPDEIPQLIEPIANDAADLVIGFRSFRQMPFYRRFGRTVLDHVTGAGGVVTDSQCGFRALDRGAIELLEGKLNKGDFLIESEMVRAANDRNFSLRITEVPIQCKYGNFDTSTKNPWRHGFGNLGIGRNIAWFSENEKVDLYKSEIKYICAKGDKFIIGDKNGRSQNDKDKS